MLSRRRRFAMPFALSGALAAVSLMGVAEPAHATTGPGTASATTAEVALDVHLLSAVDIPVDVSLNKVSAPASVSGAALTAVVGGGVEHDQPVNLLMAQAGRTDAIVDAHGSHASVTLADARLHVPGLPLTELLGVHAVSAEADCPVDGAPTASAEALGEVTVFGLHVHLNADGVTRVPVPALGEVVLKLSQHATTSDTAAATAVELDVDVNPLALNVAAVRGKFVLADVSCTKGPASGSSTGGSDGGPVSGGSGGGTPSTGPSQSPTGGGTGVTGGKGASGGSNGGLGLQSAQPSLVAALSSPPAEPSGSTNLAETGSSSATPVIAGAALVVLGAGGGAVVLTRRRRRS